MINPERRKHQRQDNHHIDVQHIQPIKDHRVQLLDRAGVERIAISVLPFRQIEINILGHLVQTIIVIRHARSACFDLYPSRSGGLRL